MTTHMPRLSRPVLVGLSGIVIAILLASGFALLLLPRFSSNALAATLPQPATMTCVQRPTLTNCNDQDPQQQGCAADAHTIEQAAIQEQGFTIGRVERRYSIRCQSWWGRVFDTRPGSRANMFLTIAGTTLSASPTFVSTQYRILYSSMVFDATPTQASPTIIGTLEIDGILTAPSATLPAVIVPGSR